MSEHFPGAQAKVEEYALRIINGENPDDVLQGADAFRPGVEAVVLAYKEKKNTELKKQDSEEGPVVEDVPNPVLSEEAIEKREQDDKQKIEALHEELKKDLANEKPDPFAHKEVEGVGEDFKQGAQIYNTFMNIGKGISEGMKQAFDPKVQQYVDEIRSGKSKEYVLGGAPKSMVDAVEKELAKDGSENTIEQEDLEKVHGIENMKSVFEAVGKTHYLFTHQTGEDTAKNIYNSNFQVSLGTGISSTLSWVGPDNALNQIQRQINGDAHRGYKGMFVVAIPKELLDQPGTMRNKAEALELILSESPDYGKDGNPNIVIPSEYNLGYLQGEDFYFNKKLV
jgi:hypothetical protein